MKLYYIANARMPSEKAHGIQIAKTCEAFIRQGIEVVLLVPTRQSDGDVSAFYGLSTAIPTIRIPTPDWYLRGPVGFFLASFFFMARVVIMLRNRKAAGDAFVLYSVDMDTFSFSALRLIGSPFFCEMHGIKPKHLLARYFFSKVSGVIAINDEVARALESTFNLAQSEVLIEPNGVDIALFSGAADRNHARKALGIPEDQRIVVYVGRFYEWKGLDILPELCKRVPEVQCYIVGGSRERFEEVTGTASFPDNMHIAGECAVEEVPQWLAAADALLILGTKGNDSSYRYTAPMKIFEYMAASRPVIASATPAVRSIIPSDLVTWYEPDSADSIASAVESTLKADQTDRVERARELAEQHSWDARASRIAGFIQHHV